MESSVIAPRPRALHSTTQRTPTTLGTAFITIATDEAGAPFEAFVNVGKAGSDTFAVAEAMGRLVSLILRMPSPLTRRERATQIVAQLSRVGGARQPIYALPNALAVALAEQIQWSEDATTPNGVQPLGLNADTSTDVLASESQQPARLPEPAEPPTTGTRLDIARSDKVKFLQILKTNTSQGANQVTELEPELKQAVQALGQALKKTPTLRAYAEASTKLETDGEATRLLDELQSLQVKVRTHQSNGRVTQAELTRLRQLQNDVQSNRTIAAFIDAQQMATLCLPEVNQEISQLLGVDFATLGRVNTC